MKMEKNKKKTNKNKEKVSKKSKYTNCRKN